MADLCHCACHRQSSIAGFAPADVSDPVDAAIACDSCRDAHCPALLLKRLPNDPEPHAAEFCAWVDPLPDSTGTSGDMEG